MLLRLVRPPKFLRRFLQFSTCDSDCVLIENHIVLFLFCFICHFYPPFTRKRIVSLYFGREVRTRLGVAFFEVYGPPCPRTQQANLPACSPQPPINAERQAGKLWIPFFKVFCYDSTRGMNPRSTDCEADALTTTPSRRSNHYANHRTLVPNSFASGQNGYWPPQGSQIPLAVSR